jgi:hypothetical protein
LAKEFLLVKDGVNGRMVKEGTIVKEERMVEMCFLSSFIP